MTTGRPSLQLVDSLLETQKYIRLQVLVDLMGDVQRGVDRYGDYEDLDQALHVIRGEWFELRDEFEYQPPDLGRIRDEALDLAATAIRLAEEIDRGRFKDDSI